MVVPELDVWIPRPLNTSTDSVVCMRCTELYSKTRLTGNKIQNGVAEARRTAKRPGGEINEMWKRYRMNSNDTTSAGRMGIVVGELLL